MGSCWIVFFLNDALLTRINLCFCLITNNKLKWTSGKCSVSQQCHSRFESRSWIFLPFRPRALSAHCMASMIVHVGGGGHESDIVCLC